MCRVWLLTSSLCAIGLPGNSARVHKYCMSARSSSLAHELFINMYVAGHGYYCIDFFYVCVCVCWYVCVCMYMCMYVCMYVNYSFRIFNPTLFVSDAAW